MKMIFAVVMLLTSAHSAFAACKGQVVTRPNKAGVMREVCLDGSYSTCIKDSRSGGWTAKEAKTFCDRRKAAGALK
ncbi:MAG: hypothetical protein AB7G35_05070 [Hyphomicrobiaceae bacterium]